MWDIPKDNPEGRAFMISIIVFLVLATFFFAIRIWARRICKARLDGSDYTCFFGLLLSVGLTVIIWGTFSHGWGQNIQQFTLADATFAAKLFVAIDVLWNMAVTTVRISILLFYIRIFAVRRFRQVCWIVIGFNLASVVSVVLSTGLICKPIAYSYNPTIPGGHCGNLISFERYTAIWNLLADATIVVLPMPILWRLQMRTRKKIGLTIVFGMGIIICILTLTRVFISRYYQLDNNTKQNAIVALITGFEPIIGVINACLPFLPAVIKHIGESQLYLSASRSLRSTKAGSKHWYGSSGSFTPKPDKGSALQPRGGNPNDAFKKLGDRDMEMNLLDQSYLDRGHDRNYTISGGSTGKDQEAPIEPIPQPLWGGNDGMGGIQVRKDISIRNSHA